MLTSFKKKLELYITEAERLRFENIEKNLQVMIPKDISDKLGKPILMYIEKRLREFYLQNQPISQETLPQYINVSLQQNLW